MAERGFMSAGAAALVLDILSDPVARIPGFGTASALDLPFPAAAKTSPTDEDVINKLTAADLASILKWSREISRDINLSLALQRLTEIVTGKRLVDSFYFDFAKPCM